MRTRTGQVSVGALLLVLAVACGMALSITVAMSSRAAQQQQPSLAWASPQGSALSGSTPIVALVSGSTKENRGAPPSAGTLILLQKGIDRPASYQAESIVEVPQGSGVWAITWRVPGASYEAGGLTALAHVVMPDGLGRDLPELSVVNFTGGN